ncbi:hypothetical protein E2562_016516 [Oryza meyeriana var. granulata]|uniref:DUF1618 domain-containing protein n=1 Tax=Oryza meyeriana var. granulata TaxID=110450 RepID=A0A6G1C867_9ORYZ|nr:hypothetical protein E2562_016516 [Oryza meyeriana var. granulata]
MATLPATATLRLPSGGGRRLRQRLRKRSFHGVRAPRRTGWVERERDILEEAELVVLRSGEWSATRTPIIHDDGKAEELSYWQTDMAVSVGDRRLSWVDLYRSTILCDLFDESPRLRYVSLLVEAPAGECDDKYDSNGDNRRRYLMANRSICLTDGGATLKFIDIFPCCCFVINHSTSAFVINT